MEDGRRCGAAALWCRAGGLRMVLMLKLVLQWLALVFPLPEEENETSLLGSAV